LAERVVRRALHGNYAYAERLRARVGEPIDKRKSGATSTGLLESAMSTHATVHARRRKPLSPTQRERVAVIMHDYHDWQGAPRPSATQLETKLGGPELHIVMTVPVHLIEMVKPQLRCHGFVVRVE